MIADLKPYAEYKESGLPWLGRVPGHWDVLRAKLLLREVDSRSTSGKEQLLRVSQYTGVTQRKIAEGSDSPDTRASSLVGYKRVMPSDFVINIMLAWNGSMGVSRYDGIASPAYCVYRFKPGAMPWYYHELLRLPLYKGRIKTASTGVVESRLRLYSDDLGRIEVIQPPPAEQVAIVRFLDWANGRLERAIRAKRKVIALLGEQKQAIIHRAVTRGLDPSVPLKPSGIPWLGDVPQHWVVRRVASFAHKVTNGWVGPTREILRDAGAPYVQSLHVKAGEIRFEKKYFVDDKWLAKQEKIRLHAGDVVVVQTGDVGQVAHVTREFDGAGCHALIIIGTNLAVISGSYLSRVLNCWYGQVALKLIETGALLPHLNCGYVRDVQTPVPPLEEQREIEEHLQLALEPVSTAISRLEREIDLLREYRTRLTADVVTGKLDLRDAAAQLPDEALLDTVEDDTDPADELEAADEEAAA